METQVQVLKQKVARLSIFFSVFLIPHFFPHFSNAHPMIQYWQNRSQAHEGTYLEPVVTQYGTSTNYVANSSTQDLPFGASINRFYFDLNATYGFQEDWFIFARLSLLSSSTKNPVATDSSVFGFSDQLLGLAYRVFKSDGGFSLNLQAETTIPAYQDSTQKQNSEPYLGDQSFDMTYGGFLDYSFYKNWHAEGGFAYLYRSKGFSAALPWSALLKWDPPTEGFTLSTGLRGQVSLNTDSTPATISAIDTNVGAAGSYLIYSLNPSWMVAQFSAGYKIDSGQTFYALVANPISGTNTPQGLQISVGIKFDLSSSQSESELNPETKNESERNSLQKFKNSDLKFSRYDLEAKVLSANDTFYMLKIDRGSSDGILQGQVFDIFENKNLLARAKVTHLKDDEAALSVLEYFTDQGLDLRLNLGLTQRAENRTESGFTAKRALE